MYNIYTIYSCTWAARSTLILAKFVKYMCSYLSLGTSDSPGASFPDVALWYSSTMWDHEMGW